MWTTLIAFTMMTTLCFCALAPSIRAQKKEPLAGTVVVPGFIDGHKYLGLTSTEKMMYLAGYFDGMLGSTFIGTEAKRTASFHECIPGITIAQLRAIVDKYIADNPEKWGESMNVLVWFSLPKTCRVPSDKLIPVN